MPEEIGVIEEIQKGHDARKFLGMESGATPDTTPDKLCIGKLYDMELKNLFKCKQLGTFKVSRPHDYKERDVVKVVINNKRIESVAKVDQLSKKAMLLHDALGQGAIALGIVVIILLVLIVWW